MISKAAIRISLIALDSAMEREENTSARLRIHNAMCELTHELIERQAQDTAAPAGTGPFTGEELFGAPVARVADSWFVCLECGACVRHSQVHTEWHNKVADL